MYAAYFGLTENPFTLTPDPRFLFMSQRHREALAHLLYGMGEQGGFVLLTGEVGTGKTTLCRSLLDQVPEDVEVALILNPKQSATELVASVCDELGVSYPEGTESLKILIDLLNRHLLTVHSQGRRTVLIIDEAQNLSTDVLEQVRLLTNLETPTRKLLQILLIGQPELQSMMDKPELRQLGQRITARYHLTPLQLHETIAYIQHRLEVGGAKRPIFTKGALRRVHALSKGVPRLINTICDRALLGAYARKRERISRRLVQKAAFEVMGGHNAMGRARAVGWAVVLTFLCVLTAGVYLDHWSLFPGKSGVVGQHLPHKALEAGAENSVKNAKNKANVFGKEPADMETNVSPLASKKDKRPLMSGNSKKSAAEIPVRLFDLLIRGELPAGEESAFEVMGECWGVSYRELAGETPCDRLAKADLSCLSGSGNWTTLSHLNRPAVIELMSEDGRRYHVPVVALDGEAVTVVLKGQEVTVDRFWLDPLWYGDYTVLWRRPPIEALLLKEGDRGGDVQWLRAKLDLVEGVDPKRTPQPLSPLFDESLKERVQRFQRNHSVRADGVVGEQTLIQLNAASRDPAVPLLTAKAP